MIRNDSVLRFSVSGSKDESDRRRFAGKWSEDLSVKGIHDLFWEHQNVSWGQTSFSAHTNTHNSFLNHFWRHFCLYLHTSIYHWHLYKTILKVDIIFACVFAWLLKLCCVCSEPTACVKSSLCTELNDVGLYLALHNPTSSLKPLWQ